VNSCLRASDIIARWGGEEFAILLPHTNLAGAEAVAEKIRMVIGSIDHPIVGTVTASFGVAEYFPEEYTGSLFKRVDEALYRSKQEGRNRVSVSEFFTEGAVQYRIQWQETWNSGNKIIDKDHRIILGLGNKLVEDSYKMSSLEESVSRYNELLNQISAHFQREEILLKELNYSMLESHSQIHHELLEKAVAFREELREHTIDPKWLFQFLVNEIIIGHFEKEDTKYFALFQHA
jgi:hemerythrin-like metal-binding protein